MGNFRGYRSAWASSFMSLAYFVHIAHLTNIHSWKLFAYEKILSRKTKIFDHDIKLEIMRYILWFVLIRAAAYFSFIQNL